MGGVKRQAADLVGDRYRLCRLLGEGGMGAVWEATDITSSEQLALKLLKSTKEEDRKRFQRELRAAAAIRHPNVIAVRELIELPDGTLGIAMDLLEGETLGAVLRRDGRISVHDLAKVFLPVLEALGAAHALGIIHRDLKPDNVFLCGTDSEIDVKVLDFGVAKLTAEDGLAARTQALTGTGSMVGTPYYMSPEQVYAEKDLDAAADIWSLGIVFYECLTGVRPTEADTVGRVLRKIMDGDFASVTAHRADVPEDVAALVSRMLSVERKERPRDLAEIRDILERHGSPGFPAFSRASAAAPIDPHAATVATPREEPRPRASESGSPPATEANVTRADTNRGLSIAPTRRSRPRTRLVAVGAVAVVALVAPLMILRGSNDSLPSASPPTPAPTFAAEAAAPSSSPPTSAIASESAAPLPSQAPSSIPSTKPLVPAVSRPTCEKGEVLSEGHCCQRGHLWRSGRCERPLATSF